jgi:hypothetical protein
MAEYQVVYWRTIPSLVVARSESPVRGGKSERRRTRQSVELGARFQVAIDELAMRLGQTGTDAYLAGWERTPWTARDGDIEEIAEVVAGEIERAYPPARLRALMDAALEQASK